MKKALSWLLTAAMALSLAACSSNTAGTADESAQGGGETADPVELTVFAAASLTETLNQIAEDYKTVAPDVTLTFNFDSSGTLKTQIQEGAVCDLFISAGQKQMDQLDASADASVNTEGLDFVMTAMFVVIFLEQWLKEKDHTSALAGLGISLLCLAAFGAENFILPAMAGILLALSFLRKPLEKGGMPL